MKNVISLTLTILFVFAIVILFKSCNVKEGNPEPEILNDLQNNSNKVILKTPFYFDDGSSLPIGTILKPALSKTGIRYTAFILPKNYRLIGTTSSTLQNTNVMLEDGGITCTCSKGSGCSPFTASGPNGTIEGCAIGSGCTECKATKSAIIAGDIVDFKSSDIIDLGIGISLVIDKAELKSLKSPISTLFEIPYIQEKLQEYGSEYQNNQLDKVRNAKQISDLPSGYAMMPVNVYGRMVLLPLEYAKIKSSGTITIALMDKAVSDFIEEIMEDGKASCKCNSGSSGCSLKSKSIPFIGSATWCDAGSCTSCTLNN
jgi:hypothetical protein